MHLLHSLLVLVGIAMVAGAFFGAGYIIGVDRGPIVRARRRRGAARSAAMAGALSINEARRCAR